MGQCFGTEDGSFLPFRQKRGYDRFTTFAPKSKWRYADEHLLTEIQDPRSDDELDLSDVRRQTGHEPNGRQNPQTSANVRTGLRQERYLKSLIPSNLLQL
ncbi:hypothetical protein pdam_00023141 [Pocillopora damicornis]|uniref:Uncharacterized protein n=1 Tax=Pocillopora damicornis TaxID=46731 RepID=A0A3M6TIP4_POCDA|nr:hypothetical protein pdam_00023141 [Pocillopora damicornis]